MMRFVILAALQHVAVLAEKNVHLEVLVLIHVDFSLSPVWRCCSLRNPQVLLSLSHFSQRIISSQFNIHPTQSFVGEMCTVGTFQVVGSSLPVFQETFFSTGWLRIFLVNVVELRIAENCWQPLKVAGCCFCGYFCFSIFMSSFALYRISSYSFWISRMSSLALQLFAACSYLKCSLHDFN